MRYPHYKKNRLASLPLSGHGNMSAKQPQDCTFLCNGDENTGSPAEVVMKRTIGAVIACKSASTRKSNTDTSLLELSLQRTRVRDAKVEDAGGKCGVGTASSRCVREDVGEVLRAACAA